MANLTFSPLKIESVPIVSTARATIPRTLTGIEGEHVYYKLSDTICYHEKAPRCELTSTELLGEVDRAGAP
jgi:hypothetical protein